MLNFLIFLFGVSTAHMSMQYPYPRDTLSGVSYAVWQQNEPMYSVHPTICHSLDKDSSIRGGNSFTATDKIAVDIYGSAPHNGGHCAFWWSTDEVIFTKIIDIKDCTLYDTTEVMLPATMSTACATRCVFAWSWIPVSSGACEVYMNCADIQVKNTTGPGTSESIELNFQTNILDNSGCSRVDDTTHWSTTFGDLKTNYTTQDYGTGSSSGGSSSQPVVSADTDSIEDDIIETNATYCANPNAPKINASISNSGLCGNNTAYRCDDGQCCSKSGYCGPELDGYNGTTPLYINYEPNKTTAYWTNSSAAIDAYCSNNQGDWRLVSCATLVEAEESSGYYLQYLQSILFISIITTLYNII